MGVNEYENVKTISADSLVGTVKVEGDQKAKQDKGKIRYLLVPRKIIRAIAEVREYGVKKYGSIDNWKNVGPERFANALMRHIYAWLDGEEKDEESGLPHLWHAACNVAFLIEMGVEKWK